MKCLSTLSSELKGTLTSGVKHAFCWEIVNSVYEDIPSYPKLSLQKYDKVIKCTGAISKSKFKEWYKIDTRKLTLVVKESSRSGHYFIWITAVLKKIMERRRALENETCDRNEMETILVKCSEMNKLLEYLLPREEALKLHFDHTRVQKAVNEFDDAKKSIIGHLIRTISFNHHNLT